MRRVPTSKHELYRSNCVKNQRRSTSPQLLKDLDIDHVIVSSSSFHASSQILRLDQADTLVSDFIPPADPENHAYRSSGRMHQALAAFLGALKMRAGSL